MILVTGCSGFIGGRLMRELSIEGAPCRGLSRHALPIPSSVCGDLLSPCSLDAACADIDCVFHCAGYAHAFSALRNTDAELHWRVNYEGTRNLLEAATRAGVSRFVYLSSVKAMAEPGDDCVAEDHAGKPTTAYGQAKLAAEQAILDAGRQHAMHVVNLRLAMVYGAGGHGNLERMAHWVKRGCFPPLPETANHRSLIHVDDVVSAMRRVADDPRANGRTYIVASQEAPSGRALLDALRTQLGRPPCTWSVPSSTLDAIARAGDLIEYLTHRRMPFDSEVLQRLLGSAWYSPALIERELGWRAEVSLAEGLQEMQEK